MVLIKYMDFRRRNTMKKLPLAIAIASSLAILGGCASQQAPTNDDTARLQAELDRVNAEKARLAAQAAEADRLRRELAAAQSSSTTTQTSYTASGDLLPPNAQPGECYSRVLVPAVYETTTEQVLAKTASERVEVVPATYEFVEETVMTREASSKLEVIPATYRTVTEEIMVEPEKTVLREVPAQYGTESEQILIKPAYTTWKKGRGPIEKVDASTGEIMCLVEVPAEYRTVTKRVVVSPASTVSDVIPAVFKTVTRTVLDQPATTREIEIPAQYDTVKVRKLVTPASEQRFAIPEEYTTVSKRALVSDSFLEWRPILCETNTTPGLISRLQRSLNEAGYEAGSVDGVLGSATMRAVNKYQLDNGLASGQLTIATLEKLGVSL